MKLRTAAALAVLALLIYFFIIRRKSAPSYYTIEDFNAANSQGDRIPEGLLPNAKILLDQVNIIQDELYKLDKSYKMQFTSVYRSPAHNSAIGGAQNSKHMSAQAIDFKVQGLEPKAVQNLIVNLVNEGKLKNAGLGRGATFTHYNYRDDRQNSSWAYVGDGGSNTYSVDFAVMARQNPNAPHYILQPVPTLETIAPGDEDI